MAAQFYMPGFPVIVKFLMFFMMQVYGTFQSNTDIVCQMMRDLSCNGSFIKRIDITCPNPRNLPLGLGEGSHSSKCSHNEDCTTWNSVCFEGVCLCKLGHYFSCGNNTCLMECSEYEKKMDSYKGVGIIDHNDKSVNRPNLTSCVEECLEEEEFTCVTVEYNPTTARCLLSVDGYLDIEEKDREVSNQWILSQRQCK